MGIHLFTTENTGAKIEKKYFEKLKLEKKILEMSKIQSSIPVESWTDDDNGIITRLHIVTGKYNTKFTAIGSITVWYNGVPAPTRGRCKNLTHQKGVTISLNPGESITSMKIYTNLLHHFVCGLHITTSSNRQFGPFGLASRDLKSPYSHGYYISSLSGSAGDVLMDLGAKFASTFASPFIGISGSDQNTESDLVNVANSTTSTISSRGSAGSGYHTDEELTGLKPVRSYEFENRLHAMEKPLRVSDLTLNSNRQKPPPPPRSTPGLRSLKSSINPLPRRNSSLKGSTGSLLTNRPILARSTTMSTV